MERSKIRLRNNVWEKLELEAKRLNKTPLETLYFAIDMYFTFLAGNINPNNPIFPSQPVASTPPAKVEPPKPQDEYEIDLDI